MTNVGKLLEQQAQDRRTTYRTAQGKLLLDFFKVTLFEEVQRALEENREPAWLVAPQEIRHLFAKPFDGELADASNPRSEFWNEWVEIHEWSVTHGLRPLIGHTTDDTNKGNIPWDQYRWCGTLVPSTASWFNADTGKYFHSKENGGPSPSTIPKQSDSGRILYAFLILLGIIAGFGILLQ